MFVIVSERHSYVNCLSLDPKILQSRRRSADLRGESLYASAVFIFVCAFFRQLTWHLFVLHFDKSIFRLRSPVSVSCGTLMLVVDRIIDHNFSFSRAIGYGHENLFVIIFFLRIEFVPIKISGCEFHLSEVGLRQHTFVRF